jgi:hypothetical protein
MVRISMDLTENEDKPLIKEVITCNQCVNRIMNDVSKGAMIIKEQNRFEKENQEMKYTLEKLRLHGIITTTGQKIVLLHLLTLQFNVDLDSTKHIQSYLFQNGSKIREKLQKLHNRHYYISIYTYMNLFHDLYVRQEKFNVRIDYVTEDICYFYFKTSDRSYKNNNPYSDDLNSDLNWVTHKYNTPFITMTENYDYVSQYK